MPEPEDFSPSGLHLPASDPAAPALESLRAMASLGPVQPSTELLAFFDDPAGQAPGATSHPRSDLVTVVRLPIRRVGRVAVAVGAALALAALGGAAVASTGGGHDREPAQVQQDDPSDTTTTTSTETETEPSETETEPSESEAADPTETEATDATGTHTANPTAYANHHDGVGSDDQHADVNGGGEVDHHAKHSATAAPTGGDVAKAHTSKGGGGSHRH